MIASSRSFSSALLALVVPALLGGACVDHQPGVSGTQSLSVHITAPTDLGSQAAPLPDTSRTVSIEFRALDAQGQLDDYFDGTLDLYPHFLGTLTPPPFEVGIYAGLGNATIDLPQAFGPTYLWLEDVQGDAPTFATGTSETLWYRDPFIEDVSTPDLTRPATWLYDSPLEGKQVTINSSKHGANGRLVVTGVYTQGYSMSDVDCTTLPCVADPFNHFHVFTFGRPRAEDGTAIEVGHTIASVSGGVTEFIGYTELGFPRSTLTSAPPDETLIPDPVVVDPMWLSGPQDPQGNIKLEELESGLIAVDGATVCPLDEDWTDFKQWKLDLGLGCGRPVNVITSGTISSFDPNAYVGQNLTRVVGTLRTLDFDTGGTIWILLPRRASDITF